MSIDYRQIDGHFIARILQVLCRVGQAIKATGCPVFSKYSWPAANSTPFERNQQGAGLPQKVFAAPAMYPVYRDGYRCCRPQLRYSP